MVTEFNLDVRDKGKELNLFHEDQALAQRPNTRQNYSSELANIHSMLHGITYADAKATIDVGLEVELAEQSRLKASTAFETLAREELFRDSENIDQLTATVQEQDKTREQIRNTKAPEFSQPIQQAFTEGWNLSQKRRANRLASVAKSCLGS